MGIDASTLNTGWAILNQKTKKRVDSGIIKMHKDIDWRHRIQNTWEQLCKIIEKYKPEIIYAEDVPMKDGKSTIMKLGAVQGMVLCLAAKNNILTEFLLPANWRSGLGLFDGTRAGTQRNILKKKAIEMANDIFSLELKWVKDGSKLNEDDEAEALLIAYSQLNKWYITPQSQ